MKKHDTVIWGDQKVKIHNIFRSKDGQTVYEIIDKNKNTYFVSPFEVTKSK